MIDSVDDNKNKVVVVVVVLVMQSDIFNNFIFLGKFISLFNWKNWKRKFENCGEKLNFLVDLFYLFIRSFFFKFFYLFCFWFEILFMINLRAQCIELENFFRWQKRKEKILFMCTFLCVLINFVGSFVPLIKI